MPHNTTSPILSTAKGDRASQSPAAALTPCAPHFAAAVAPSYPFAAAVAQSRFAIDRFADDCGFRKAACVRPASAALQLPHAGAAPGALLRVGRQSSEGRKAVPAYVWCQGRARGQQGRPRSALVPAGLRACDDVCMHVCMYNINWNALARRRTWS